MLTTEEKLYINSEISLHGKKKWVAILLGVFLGHLGIHNFYVRNKNKAKIQLIIGGIGVLTLIIFIGYPIVLGVWIWALIDLLKISDQVDDINEELKQRIIRDIKAIA